MNRIKTYQLQLATLLPACLFFACTFYSYEASSKTYAGCSKLAAKIENVQSKMRQGYTAQQGERYKARLRYLKEQRNKCERHAEKLLQAQNKVIKNRQQYRANTDSYIHHNNQSNWSYTQASKSRNKDWQAMQESENKRIKLLNEKYADTIKDAKSKKDDN